MTVKELVDVLSALLTPVIALLAVYIAWQQYKIQHRSYNGQMYERRREVFKAFMAYLSQVMRDGKTSYERLGQFYAEASEADFLFGEAAINKREELYSRGIDMVAGHERMYPSDGSPGLPVGAERSKVAHEHSEHLKWVFKQIPEVKRIFKAEMSI